MATFVGCLEEFHPKREKVSDYLDRMSLCFEANSVTEDKQVLVLLTAMGGEMYTLLMNVVSPAKPHQRVWVPF